MWSLKVVEKGEGIWKRVLEGMRKTELAGV